MASKNFSARTQSKAHKYRWGIVGAGVGAVVGSLAAGTVSGLGGYFARQVVTPAKEREEDLSILAVVQTEEGKDVIVPATTETTVEGTYSLYWDAGRGHARIGQITSFVPSEGTVQRRIEEVYEGDIYKAVRGWWSGVVYDSPERAGFEVSDVNIPIDAGEAPAWLLPGTHRASTWAICVHGRGATRLEGIRALRTISALGMTGLLISYRNDGVGPRTADGRYGLGATEWEDVDSAIDYALDHGAEDIVLFGWSMGGAISLQVADHSRHQQRIRALVLTGPVVNWFDVLAHQARVNKLPSASGRYGQWLLSNKAGQWITGLATPLDLSSLNWVARHEELRKPTLILHSEDDDFVPVGPSVELAEKTPEMVTFERFTRARHTREWNVDPERWHHTVVDWLTTVFSAKRPVDPRNDAAETSSKEASNK
ncbi:alpha/beta hydrolase family protein [Neomicrococcus lactis]